MPEDKTNQLPDDGDVKGPKPPTNPVEYSRWLQRPQVTPKKPKVQPDDSALRIDSLKRPDVNRSIGTDKPNFPPFTFLNLITYRTLQLTLREAEFVFRLRFELSRPYLRFSTILLTFDLIMVR